MSSTQDVNIFQVLPNREAWIGRISGVAEMEIEWAGTNIECWHLWGTGPHGRRYLAGFRAAGLKHDHPEPKVLVEENACKT